MLGLVPQKQDKDGDLCIVIYQRMASRGKGKLGAEGQEKDEFCHSATSDKVLVTGFGLTSWRTLGRAKLPQSHPELRQGD